MAINDSINFNSTAVHYFKFYNDENNTFAPLQSSSSSSPVFDAVAESNFSLHNNYNNSIATAAPSQQNNYSIISSSTPSISSFESQVTPSNSPTVPLVAATTLTTITSTIINNYSSQNYSNYTNNNSNSYNNNNTNTNNASYSYNNLTSTLSNNFNQSTLYQYKSINNNVSSDDNNYNDSAKISYESGSNFMLLLEDFGEYFYNYNGSDFNSSISIYQANCSLTNSTSCGDASAREYKLINFI